MCSMQLPQPDFFIPDSVSEAEAQARCSHLAIGAHQDDLEFMAYHGISVCYEEENSWFGGIVCTDGGGSSRAGKYAHYTDAEMRLTRAEEQRQAASLGKYSFVNQLGWASSAIKDPALRRPIVDQLEAIFLQTQPDLVYTHNPADKHLTHVAVCLAVVEAIRRVPPHSRPRQVYGCEVWRDLDWLPDEEKVALDVSAYPELAEKLNACFDSQIAGGKNYGEAVIGRRKANATFYSSHSIDMIDQLWFAMDLTPLSQNEELKIEEFVEGKLEAFRNSVINALQNG
ncbi:MAG: PIG-L family deacetylase [Verrucomicrobiota bacterium]